MEAIGLLFVLAFFALWIAAVVYWIVAIVEVAKIPEQQYQAAGTEKILWVLVVVLVGVIGALIWLIAKRKDVLAAQGRIPAPAPGWYPEPTTGGLRWWDGVQWTEQRHAPPPP